MAKAVKNSPQARKRNESLPRDQGEAYSSAGPAEPRSGMPRQADGGYAENAAKADKSTPETSVMVSNIEAGINNDVAASWAPEDTK